MLCGPSGPGAALAAQPPESPLHPFPSLSGWKPLACASPGMAWGHRGIAPTLTLPYVVSGETAQRSRTLRRGGSPRTEPVVFVLASWFKVQYLFWGAYRPCARVSAVPKCPDSVGVRWGRAGKVSPPFSPQHWRGGRCGFFLLERCPSPGNARRGQKDPGAKERGLGRTGNLHLYPRTVVAPCPTTIWRLSEPRWQTTPQAWGWRGWLGSTSTAVWASLLWFKDWNPVLGPGLWVQVLPVLGSHPQELCS